ncbi:phospholipase A-2-activating protein [Entomortierella parvispora]|uniref:Phospholipase A-2-activating protein n=1 Tax=Entomortierella parvispora TaxID=205924 RepID=A0A9P3LW04_9FUNG|nr:phospholipase A-2-activating protein [Entomortierella parvispora]
MASSAAPNKHTWQLSAILTGHQGDVKAVIAPTDSTVVSVSRDKTARTWKRQSTNTFSEERIFLGHSNYVNSVAFIGASEANPNGLIVTGGSDKKINVWDPEDASQPIYTLTGHSDNVCSLYADTDGHIVSGSWDKTAKIWRNWQCVYTLEGHTQAIWGVLELEHEVIVTASADKTIGMWKDGKKIKTVTGHEDCVRSLALLPGIGFVSCGNDGAVIVWSNNGDPLQALDGHTSFVYSLATLPTGEIFSSGEDRTVRVWQNGECTQTIIHPCVSVWCVATLPNGDIVSGGSDGFVRIFTRTAERVADAATLKAYDEENAAASIPANQVGDIKKDDLPGPEALEQPGRKDQDVKMVRVGNVVEAHMWSSAEQAWSKIGEVVDAVGQNRKQLYNGIEYDHVFDIDVGEGVPALKLPFNVTENPYTAAQNFLDKYELPQGYLDQVADFITKNARAVSQGEFASAGDPFTGGSRYTPGQSSSSGGSMGSYNPWGNDTPKTQAQPAVKRIVPQLTNVPFRDANLPAILKKILQLNTELASSGVALNDSELTQLDALIKFLSSPPKQPMPQPQFVSLLLKIFNTWPEANRFPALDLLRLLALYSQSPAETPDLLKTLLAATRTHETSLMLVARLVVNFCETELGKVVAVQDLEGTLEVMEDDAVWQSTNKNLKLAVATVYMSYSTLLLKRHDDDALAIQYVGVLTKILEKERDQQVQYRLLVALGNLIFGHESARESAAIFGVKEMLQSAVLSRATSEKIATSAVANEIVKLL